MSRIKLWDHAAIQLILLASFFVLIAERNQDWLIDWSTDGGYVLTNIRKQFELAAWPSLEHGWNPLQGLGTPWYPFQAHLFPEFWAAWLANPAAPNQLVLLTVSALLLFAALTFLARTVGATPRQATLAGWLLVVTIYPLWPSPLVYPIVPIAPQTATDLAVISCAVASCYRLDWNARLPFWATTFIVCCVWLIIAQSVGLLILVPGFLLLVMGTLFDSKRSGLLRASLITATGIAFIVSGAFWFVLATFLNTPAGLFGADFASSTNTLATGALVFQGDKNTIAGLAAALGALTTTIFASDRLRRLALIVLSAEALAVLGSFLSTLPSIGWIGIHIVYFEFVMWPAYAIVVAYALSRLGDAVWSQIAQEYPRQLLGFAFVSALIGYGLWHEVPKNPSREPWPPALAAIPDYLNDKLAVASGGEFRGRNVSIFGVEGDSPSLWGGSQSYNQHMVARATGNDHRLSGLWWFGIPTLEEYSSIYSPRIYKLWPSLLPEGKRLSRNILTVGRENSAIFPLFGVRTIVSSHELTNFGGRATEKKRIQTQLGELILYEVEGSNIHGYSPIEVVVEPDLNRALLRITSDELDTTKQVLLEHPESGGELFEATERTIRLIPNGLELHAKSKGRSIVVLPFAFSHCWQQATGTPVRLVNANGLLLGVIFEGALDTTLLFRFGALGHGECRLRDYVDNTRLFGARQSSLSFLMKYAFKFEK